MQNTHRKEPKLDFTKGDTLILKAEAYDTEKPELVLYPAGTEVVIEQVFGDVAHLRFPDGGIVPHTSLQILMFFYRKVNGNLVYRRETTGLGTPPKELSEYLPKECDWKRNYRFKVILELEERELKSAACPSCYTDLDNIQANVNDLLKCPSCDKMVLPINPSTFEYPKEEGHEQQNNKY